MRIERRVINEEKGILQITTPSERFYGREAAGKTIWVPSVTWICEFYPKGKGYWMWLANNKSWDESEALKQAAGERGGKIHQGCSMLMDGITIKLDTKITNPDTGLLEEFTPDEYEAVVSFSDWWNKNDPILVDKDFTVFDSQDLYAGTVDILVKLDGKLTLIDLKTGQNIWPSYELQVSAYKHAIMGEMDLAILQLGYRKNKAKYKYTEIEDKFDLFLAARQIWANEMKDVQPHQKDYPLSIKLKIKKEA